MQTSSKNIVHILVSGYILIPLLTPSFQTLDSNGPKFMAISSWLIISVLWMMFRGKDCIGSFPQKFFKTPVGIAYSLFLVFTLLSITQAVNSTESWIYLTKILTIFIASIVIGSLLHSQHIRMEFILLILSVILLTDGIQVIIQAVRFILGRAENISEFTSVYANKNVFASAILMKLPAAIGLLFFFTGRKKIIGYLALTAGILGTLILSSRAFYFGLALMWMALIGFAVLYSLKQREKKLIRPMIISTGILIAAILLFSLTQKHFYPQDADPSVNKAITERMASSFESGENLRIDSWNRSWKLIKENPILGVGTGNWKISILEYENPAIADYQYMYKNHNDFIEVTAETGIAGGLSYLAIMVLVLVQFVRSVFRRNTSLKETIRLFYPALAMLAYVVDAFFNFPADRPEIQSLFALLIGITVAWSIRDVPQSESTSKPIRQKIILLAFLMILVPITYLQWLNVKSLQIQRMVKEDLLGNTYAKPASFFLEKYPDIPNINCVGSPIVIDQVRYLLHENNDQKAKELLLKDASSPYDMQKEYYLGMIYARADQPDSARMMLERVYQNKPLFVQGIILYTSIRFDQGDQETARQILEEALSKQPENAALQKHRELLETSYASYSKGIYEKAKSRYEQKDYAAAIPLLNELLNREPDFIDLYPIRAYCHYYMENYKSAIHDLTNYAQYRELSSEQLRVRSDCYRKAGDEASAAKDEKAAKQQR